MATADDFRFVRLWWEVPAHSIGRRGRWLPFAKGGDYSPYYADLYLVIDWEDEGQRIKGFERAFVRNESFYFRPGLTWSRRSQKGFSVRPVPADAIFGDKGPMILLQNDPKEELDRLMAYLNSGLAAALLEAMVAFGSYEVGAVQRIPYLDVGEEAGKLAEELARARAAESRRSEVDHQYVSPWTSEPHADGELNELSQQIDETVSRVAGVMGMVEPRSTTYPSRWFDEDYKAVTPATAHEELSYLLGAALGRWDIRIASGVALPPPLPGPYDPLRAASRGMLIETGLPVHRLPDDYPLAVPADRILHDEPGHPHDVISAIEAAADTVRLGSNPPMLKFQDEVRDLRRHLRGAFFGSHQRDYSATRRHAPIYWYLAIPSREWGLWLYAPALSREMLFAIARAAGDKLRRLRERAEAFQRRDEGSERAVVEKREKVEALGQEVEKFAGVAEKVAHSGWAPDLNDGLVLCAAPLEPLFADERWRRLVADYRKDLEKGKYPWASVQRDFFGDRP